MSAATIADVSSHVHILVHLDIAVIHGRPLLLSRNPFRNLLSRSSWPRLLARASLTRRRLDWQAYPEDTFLHDII
ncbi:hypothetical protein TIFTF001_055055 [Ficus carica]|uniref:Uncharacterized protein n=1 Tax=Ficus carica TaxID=3494 RepID=A0AA88EBH2_FICCA|nr:hypothetical protein TIFTF001_055055 [Ficus carica]